MRRAYYVDFDLINQRGRYFARDLERESDGEFKVQYFQSMGALPEKIDCDLLIADHPQITGTDGRDLRDFARANPRTRVVITRNLDFPWRPSQDPDIPNVYCVERSYVLEQGLDRLLE